MRWVTRKLGLTWDITTCLAFAGVSLLNFYDYNNDTKTAHLIAGVGFALLCLAKVSDIFDHIRSKQNTRLNERLKGE